MEWTVAIEGRDELGEVRQAQLRIEKDFEQELPMPGDPLREFVVSVDTAHVRCAGPKASRNFEIVVARCGRGGRGSPPGHYFATADTSQQEMRARTMQALQSEGYSGHGEITILSDGTEIMKRLPKALPKPATHIIDWFHLAMKIQPCGKSLITPCAAVR